VVDVMTWTSLLMCLFSNDEFEALFPSYYGTGPAETHINSAFQFLFPHIYVKY